MSPGTAATQTQVSFEQSRQCLHSAMTIQIRYSAYSSSCIMPPWPHACTAASQPAPLSLAQLSTQPLTGTHVETRLPAGCARSQY